MKESLPIAKVLIRAFKAGHKLLVCGNGGSAAMAIHFSSELICRFEKDRRALPAIALTADSSILTAWSNDNVDGFEMVFARQIQALGQKGDVLIVLSTSGRSKNCLRAIDAARDTKMHIIDFPRKGKGTAAIQEYQLKLLHHVCRRVENAFVD